METTNPILFKTQRLWISRLQKKDQLHFHELLTNPAIINPIPQPEMTEAEILNVFEEQLNNDSAILKNNRNAIGVYEKGKEELIGLFLLLVNNENDRELGYRFRPPYWGKGYGTELTKGIINYVFDELALDKITADACTENLPSVKILTKFLDPVKEFTNEVTGKLDRRYELKKENWG